jgi:uncharacterized protein (TIRG00374 family)
MPGKHKLFLLAGLVVAALCLAFALWNIDLGLLGATLRSSRKSGIAAFLLVLFAFYWVKAERWRVLLAPIKRIPTARLFPALMVGYGVSMLVPMHLGEVARVMIVKSEHGLRVSALAMSIAFERLLDLVAIPLLFAVAMLAGNELPVVLIRAGYVMGLIGLTGLVGLATFVLWPAAVLRLTAGMLAPLPDRLRALVLTQLEAGAEGIAALRNVAQMSAIVVLTLVQWTLMWLCVWVSVWSVGIEVSWSASLLTVALINVAVALPTSPGYVGSVQAAFVLALLPFGVDREAAVAASIYFHLLIYVAVVGTALLFLHRAGRSLRSLLAAPAPIGRE